MSNPGEIIENLQNLQRVVAREPSFDAKIAKMQSGVYLFGLSSLYEKRLWVDAKDVLGRSVDEAPDSLIRLEKGLSFIATLTMPSYMYDESIPIDSLMLQFRSPESLYIPHDDTELSRNFVLRVPVLAIEDVAECSF